MCCYWLRSNVQEQPGTQAHFSFLPQMPTGSDSKKDFSLNKTKVEVRTLTEQETELSGSPQASHPKQRPAVLLHYVGRKETGRRFPAWREQFQSFLRQFFKY